MKRLEKAVRDQKKSTQADVPQISGLLGIPINGQKTIEVPNRNGFVYVRLRNNQSEVIQAFNNKVAPAYGLPVKVIREGNRYTVLSVDTQRYENNWTSFAPFLPRHGNTHSFDIESGGGADIVWVYPRQFMPALVLPSGSLGGRNVIVSSYTLKKDDGTWRYVGNTGTANLTTYNPASVTGAVIALIFIDTASGNPSFLINSGSVFSSAITGTSQIIPYIPTITNPATQIPLAAVRLVTGTSQISWDNIYDVRQFIHTQPTGSAGSGITSVTVQDEGVSQGNVTTFNFVGANVHASVSGSIARVFVTGSTGSSEFVGTPSSAVLTNASGTLFTPTWLKWGTDARPYLEFGADVPNKETNAGRMGYGSFGNDNLLQIIGAGSGTNRTVRIDDNLIVGDGFTTRFSNLSDPSATYNINGSPHTHAASISTGTVVVQDEGLTQGSVPTLNFAGQGVVASLSGSIAQVLIPGGRVLLYDYQVFNSGTNALNVHPQGVIPSTYKDLEMNVSLRTTRFSTFEAVRIRFNSDNGTNYDSYLMFHNFDSVFNDEATATGTIPNILYADGSLAPDHNYAAYTITLHDYASLAKNKMGQSRGSQQTTRNINSLFLYDGTFLWHPDTPAAITKIELVGASGGNFVSGSRVTLWGIT